MGAPPRIRGMSRCSSFRQPFRGGTARRVARRYAASSSRRRNGTTKRRKHKDRAEDGIPASEPLPFPRERRHLKRLLAVLFRSSMNGNLGCVLALSIDADAPASDSRDGARMPRGPRTGATRRAVSRDGRSRSGRSARALTAARAFVPAPAVASLRRREASEPIAAVRRPTPSSPVRGGPCFAPGPRGDARFQGTGGPRGPPSQQLRA
jgi:hypothetical protein